jgi:hypothetical protein
MSEAAASDATTATTDGLRRKDISHAVVSANERPQAYPARPLLVHP